MARRPLAPFATLLAATLLALTGGCTAPPRVELQAARTAVAQAYNAGAEELAPEEYRDASRSLSEGEELVRRGQYKMAREVLPFAEAYALRAITRVQEEEAVRALQKLQVELERERLRLAAIPQEPEAVRPPTAPTKQAITAASLIPKKPPAPPPPLLRYTVSEGENLSTIAARREIYGDSQLWPLLYRANRDQIKDPRNIYPGQVLTIPRNVSSADLADAREKAAASELFPLLPAQKTTPSRSR